MRHHDCRPSALCHTLSRMKGVGDGGVPEAKEQRAVLLHHVEISIVPISSAMDGRPHQRALGRGLHVVMQFESCGRADAAEYSYHSPQLCVIASIRFPAPAAGAVVAQIMFLHGHRLTREALHRRQTELRGSRDALAGDAEVVAEVSRWWQRNAAGPLPSALRRCRRGVDVRRHADGARGGATRTLLHTVSTAGKQTELSLGVRLGHPESRELPWSRAPTIEL
ncbi:hypothetical protein JHW43_000908 [Diplocarpon mali]|nr:hypothetical protein JHW43_000908 [Diplocarpon mali]